MQESLQGELEVLASVAESAGRTLMPRRLLRESCRRISERLGFSTYAVYLADPADDLAPLALAGGRRAAWVRRRERTCIRGAGTAGRAWATGAVALDCAPVAGVDRHQVTRLAFPLRAGRADIGAVTLIAETPRPVAAAERCLLEIVGAMLGLGMENATRYERMRVRARQERIENALARQLARSLDRDRTALVTVGAALRALRASRCYFASVSGGDLTVVTEARRGDWPAVAGTYRPAEVSPHVLHRVLAGQVVAIDDVATDPRTAGVYQRIYAPSAVRSTLVAPLLAAGRLGALIGVHQCNRRRHWTADDIALVEAIARQAALALAGADILERTRASEREYMALYDEAPDMYHLLDAAGTIVSCNATEARELGYAKAELVGTHWTAYVVPGRARDHLAEGMALFARGQAESCTVEADLCRRDGSVLSASVRAVPAYADGEYRGARVLARDVTGEKALQQQLVQAQKMDSLGTLAGGIAHDFNNHLTGVIGYAALIRRKTPDDSPIHRHAVTIEEAGRRAADLARQLLTFARNSPIEAQSVSVNDVVQETASLLGRSIGKHIALETDLAPDLRRVQADPTQIEQVLVNLCLNARDAMPQGGRLTVMTRNLENWSPPGGGDPRPGILVAVADTGEGIGEAVLPRVFEPFFTTKRPGEGTGLGLAMVYGIVTRHGGTVHVTTEPGSGATFTVVLPVDEAPPAEAPTAEAATQTPSRSRILVVDDEPVVRGLMHDLLASHGLEVHLAPGGRDALEVFRANPGRFDLVLLDLMMPELGGRETFWQLRAIDPGVRVILMSGFAETETVAHLLQAGACRFLPKPCTTVELLTAIHEALNAPSPGRSPRAGGWF